jgi:hypothetical protein
VVMHLFPYQLWFNFCCQSEEAAWSTGENLCQLCIWQWNIILNKKRTQKI